MPRGITSLKFPTIFFKFEIGLSEDSPWAGGQLEDLKFEKTLNILPFPTLVFGLHTIHTLHPHSSFDIQLPGGGGKLHCVTRCVSPLWGQGLPGGHVALTYHNMAVARAGMHGKRRRREGLQSSDFQL